MECGVGLFSAISWYGALVGAERLREIVSSMNNHIHLLITGGTIDSVFDPARDSVIVNDSSTIESYLAGIVQPHFKLSQEIVTMRDSRDITDNS